MPEQIYTFSDEELARMFKSGEMKVLTSPEAVQTQSDHERALEKAKKLFGKDFKDIFRLEIGGKHPVQLEKDLEQAGVLITAGADIIFGNYFNTLSQPEILNLIFVSCKFLGFQSPTTFFTVYRTAKELGLELCPAEVGPHLALQYAINRSQENFFYLLGMSTIPDSFGYNRIFTLSYYQADEKLILGGASMSYREAIDPNVKFIFSL